jgi:hypothetical protein
MREQLENFWTDGNEIWYQTAARKFISATSNFHLDRTRLAMI